MQSLQKILKSHKLGGVTICKTKQHVGKAELIEGI